MTTQTEALKLALEALKENQHLVADNERHAYVMEYNSIIEKCEEALAQPEQEPVKLVSYNCKCGRTMNFESDHGVVAPQRKPLTDEELFKLWLKVPAETEDRFAFARAIEAAHGIKE